MVDDVVTYCISPQLSRTMMFYFGRMNFLHRVLYQCYGFKVPILRLWRLCGLVVDGSEHKIRLHEVVVEYCPPLYVLYVQG